jgi:hypothetical protein
MRLATILSLLFLVLALSAIPAQAQYGVEFTATDTFKIVRQDSTAIFHVHIRNSGSVQDTFRISFPRRNMPANWIPLFCDSTVCYDPPFNILLNAGESFPDDPHVSIIAWQDPGTGWVECQVRSLGDTTLHREIRFWCRNDVGVENQEGFKGSRVQGVQVTPNPFREKCEIRLPSGVTVGIYDGLGRRIRELRAGGAPVLVWDGRDARGMKVPAGAYFFVSESGAKRLTGKILRIR